MNSRCINGSLTLKFTVSEAITIEEGLSANTRGSALTDLSDSMTHYAGDTLKTPLNRPLEIMD
ncbi:hypothetical protein C4D60_Mb05t13000 [Musa balbisiana]|uniref:Uncharacterized protein n=1 Tax=Musa balbisiana TaxID=52838 RepID=A0A4S8JVQ8_MUSBA|nr:hypothetical protein C4D60_Mb05t13000 [Musa balbisiana]